MLLSGKQDATLHNVRLVDIHGTHFYDLQLTHDNAPDQLRSIRVAMENVYAEPQLGDKVIVSYLINVPTEVTRP
jgi:hypothetical protein